MIKIEKNIPFPPSKFRRKDFPLDKMEIGDCFMVPEEDKDALAQACSHHHKRKGNKRFTVRRVIENHKLIYRCWRIR